MIGSPPGMLRMVVVNRISRTWLALETLETGPGR